jgi:hypothetical protein
MKIRWGVRYFIAWLLVYRDHPIRRAIHAAYAISATAVFTYLLAADFALLALGVDMFPPSSPSWPSEAFNSIVLLVAPFHLAEMTRVAKRSVVSLVGAIRKIAAH